MDHDPDQAFDVDDVRCYEQMAAAMNAQPDRYSVLGDLDLVLGVIVDRAPADAFRVRLTFDGIECVDVSTMEPGDERVTDCWLEGPLDAWTAMLSDVRGNGRATGRQTLNSLTMVGDEIRLCGTDVMGVDKFSRFNQSLQEFFDGAALAARAATS
jgi:hypothetical protein